MTLPQTTIERIRKEADECQARHKLWTSDAYALGAISEATRAVPVYEALKEIEDIVLKYNILNGDSPAANHCRNIAMAARISYESGEAVHPPDPAILVKALEYFASEKHLFDAATRNIAETALNQYKNSK